MKELIFHIGYSAGFYSEFNNMVLAMLYCQRHNIDFKLYSRDANFGYDKGWQDFFLPFCKESSSKIHHFINKRFAPPTGGKRKMLFNIYKTIFPNTYTTPELWNEFRHIDQTELSTIEVRDLSKSIIERIYLFNSQTKLSIEKLMNTIHIDEPYLAFHIRRGDKKDEKEYIQIHQYIKRAEKLSSIRTGFISTDDYSIFLDICKAFPYWNFYTLSSEKDRGFYYNNFVCQSKDEKRRDLINMFASMEYLCKSEKTFCTFSSNIGMFLGMRMGDKAIGMDFDNWLIW